MKALMARFEAADKDGYGGHAAVLRDKAGAVCLPCPSAF